MTVYNIPAPTITAAGDRTVAVGWSTPEKACAYAKRAKGTSSSLTPEKYYSIKVGGASHAYMSGYDVQWEYTTQASDGAWIYGGTVAVPVQAASAVSINAPADALRIRARVKPRATTYKTWSYTSSKGSNGAYSYSWTSKVKPYYAAGVGYWGAHSFAKDTPSAPTVAAEGNEAGTKAYVTATATDADTAVLRIRTRKNGLVQSATSKAAGGRLTVTMETGGRYEFSARAETSAGVASAWSGWTDPVWAAVGAPGIESAKSIGAGTASVKCTSVSNAALYRVRYAKTKELIKAGLYAERTSTTRTVGLDGLDVGERYWLQARCENRGGAASSWSGYESVVTGTAPEYPTTYAPVYSTTVDQPLTVSWTHNSTDGSDQTDAEIRWWARGLESDDQTDGTIDGLGTANSYTFDFSGRDNVRLEFSVRTKGAYDAWSALSPRKLVKFYPVPGVSLDTPTRLETLPARLSCTVQPGIHTTKAISYVFRLVADSSYAFATASGEEVVNAGETIWTKTVKTASTSASVELKAGEVMLANGERYHAEVDVTLSNGIARTGQGPAIEVAFSYELPEPDAFTAEANDRAMVIRPVCRTAAQVDPATGEVLSWDDASVWLDVFRVDADGGVTLVAADVMNDSNVHDPHPTFNSQHYVIVATSKVNGTQSFADVYDEAVECGSVVIQWDESWSDGASMSGYKDDEYTGGILELPYNLKLGESYAPDRVLVEYDGRSHPVLYTGTQKGETSSVSFDVPVDETDMLDGLRRLAVYEGPCYVRTPTGLGYWAKADVTLSLSYANAAHSATIQLARVDSEEA